MSSGLTSHAARLPRAGAQHSGRRARPHRHHADARARDHRGGRAAVRAADARGDRRQHGAAPAGLVGREPQAEALQDLARRRLQAAVLQDRADEFHQGPDQARPDRRDHGGDPVAEAQSARRPGHDGPGGRAAAHPRAVARRARRGGGDARDRRGSRLPVPVPPVVRAAEDVAAGVEGRVQADRRRSGDQGQDPPVARRADRRSA